MGINPLPSLGHTRGASTHSQAVHGPFPERTCALLHSSKPPADPIPLFAPELDFTGSLVLSHFPQTITKGMTPELRLKCQDRHAITPTHRSP